VQVPQTDALGIRNATQGQLIVQPSGYVRFPGTCRRQIGSPPPYLPCTGVGSIYGPSYADVSQPPTQDRTSSWYQWTSQPADPWPMDFNVDELTLEWVGQMYNDPSVSDSNNQGDTFLLIENDNGNSYVQVEIAQGYTTTFPGPYTWVGTVNALVQGETGPRDSIGAAIPYTPGPYHLALVRDASALRLYWQGVLIATVARTSSILTLTQALEADIQLNLAASNENAHRVYIGPTALAATARYSGSSFTPPAVPPSDTFTRIYFPFGEGSGDTAVDSVAGYLLTNYPSFNTPPGQPAFWSTWPPPANT
jgi:hypothetical protein